MCRDNNVKGYDGSSHQNEDIVPPIKEAIEEGKDI